MTTLDGATDGPVGVTGVLAGAGDAIVGSSWVVLLAIGVVSMEAVVSGIVAGTLGDELRVTPFEGTGGEILKIGIVDMLVCELAMELFITCIVAASKDLANNKEKSYFLMCSFITFGSVSIKDTLGDGDGGIGDT